MSDLGAPERALKTAVSAWLGTNLSRSRLENRTQDSHQDLSPLDIAVLSEELIESFDTSG